MCFLTHSCRILLLSVWFGYRWCIGWQMLKMVRHSSFLKQNTHTYTYIWLSFNHLNEWQILWLRSISSADFILLLSSLVFHPVECSYCHSQSMMGFRYRCQQCDNYQLCQECFWRGHASGSHSNQHQMKEYMSWVGERPCGSVTVSKCQWRPESCHPNSHVTLCLYTKYHDTSLILTLSYEFAILVAFNIFL